MTPARLQRILGRVTLVLTVAGAVYLFTRFDLRTIPTAGCSPLRRYAPGTTLLLDRRPSAWRAGDAVLFQSGAGELSIGDLARWKDDAAWIEVDAPDCPGASSETHGWIPRHQLAARVVFAASW